MKIDLYTKFILTVIAICLTISVLNQISVIPTAQANPVMNSLDKKINYGLVPLNPDGSINVNVKSASTMDVNIESCESYAFQYAGPMKVIIKENQNK